MNIDKVIKSIRVAFAFLFGAVLMFYAIYGWHAEWTDDWQSIIIGLIGFVFMYMPDKLQAVISQGLSKIFELTLGRFFGGGGKAAILALFALSSLSAYSQTGSVNATVFRSVNVLDSTSVLPINGSIYYNEQSDKWRIYQNSQWFDLVNSGTGGGGGVTALGSINGTTKTANGGAISGSTIYMQTADATYPGLMSTGAQTFAGDKTFTAQTTIQKADGGSLQVWTNDGGANNEYLALYNYTNDLLFVSNSNGTGAPKPIHFGVGGNDLVSGSADMSILSGGYVGIGTTAPNAPLQFANADANRKVVLSEVANNDHQFYGLGVAGNTLRFQAPSSTYAFGWYVGNGSAASVEAMSLLSGGILQTTAGGHFKGWVDSNASGLGVDVGISASEGYVIAYDRTTSTYYPIQLQGHSSNKLKISSLGNVFTGNVGIGGTPSYPFDVQTSSASAIVTRVLNSSTGGVNLKLSRTGGTVSTWDMYCPSGSTDLRFNNGSDRIYFSSTGTGTGTDWVATSDRRLKGNIKYVDSQLEKVNAISRHVVNYDRKDNGKNETGFIAQELYEVAPEYVNKPADDSTMWSVNYSKMVVPLYKAVAELTAEVEALKKELSKQQLCAH